jgi:hypothetical protein
VVTRLLRDIDEPGRADFSQRIAADKRTPKEIALTLAHDSADVAVPVLERSPVLEDEDLVFVAKRGDTAQRLAISRRDTVSERVSDTLLSFDEMAVMESLLDSSGAAISENGFQRIANRATDSNGLRERLCLRGDVPVALAKRLIPYLNDADRAKMRKLIEADTGRLSSIVKDALPMVSYDRANRAKRRLHIKHLALMVREGKVAVDGFTDDLLAGGVLDVALGFAELSQLSERDAANAILSISPEPLAMLAKVLRLGTEMYGRVDTLRRETLRLPNDVAAGLMSSYTLIDEQQALRALRFVQVRTSVAQAS